MVNTTMSQFTNAEQVMMSLTKHQELFLSLAHIASCLLLIPVHSADCERGFSAMGRIKTRLRTRLCNCSLNSLMFISIEGAKLPNFEFGKVLQTWARVRKRRLFQGEPSSSKQLMGCQT